MTKILLVEDDTNLGESLNSYLRSEGYDVDWCKSLEEGRDANIGDTDIIILDWMLPDGQGIDLLRELRQKGSVLPVIILTARAELVDKIVGLETGANDYITKPFEPRELVARVRVQLRNPATPSQSEASEVIEVGGIKMNCLERKVYFQGEEVTLTKMEYELLKLLAETPNRVYSREEILNQVWGYENYPSTRTVDTHVLQLRQKFTDQLFETVRGIGYKLSI